MADPIALSGVIDNVLAAKMHRLQRECGCRLGAAALLATLLLVPVVAGITPVVFLAHPGRSLASWVGVTVAAALFGKFSGIAIARLRLWHLRRRLRFNSGHA